jgi:methionyl-tRNA formyltransferase
MKSTYLVAGRTNWSRRAFEEVVRWYPGQWRFVSSPEQLTESLLGELEPRYVFFLHWSWQVPAAIVKNQECVCFHMTDVPYGRGGSPLQNLILRGRRSTKLTALRMTESWDAGPVYDKQDLCLEGRAEEIYIRAANLCAHMIRRIVEEEPRPVEQTGEAVVFKRRRPEQSEIPETESLQGLYDFLRMLDAEGYPRAFLAYKGFRYEFGRVCLSDGRILADVTITPAGGPKQ